MHGKRVVFSLIAVGMFLVSLPASAAEDFYRHPALYRRCRAGRRLRHLYARVARHIGKHLPGDPTPVVQNMTGAGTLIAAHYLYNKAKPDGLTLGVWNSGQVLRQALGDRAVKFDTKKFGWVGAPVRDMPSCGVVAYTGVRSLEDIVKSQKPIKIGSTRAGTTTDDLPRLLNMALGTNFDVIPGYTGTSRIRIAMQREKETAFASAGSR